MYLVSSVFQNIHPSSPHFSIPVSFYVGPGLRVRECEHVNLREGARVLPICLRPEEAALVRRKLQGKAAAS